MIGFDHKKEITAYMLKKSQVKETLSWLFLFSNYSFICVLKTMTAVPPI